MLKDRWTPKALELKLTWRRGVKSVIKNLFAKAAAWFASSSLTEEVDVFDLRTKRWFWPLTEQNKAETALKDSWSLKQMLWLSHLINLADLHIKPQWSRGVELAEVHMCRQCFNRSRLSHREAYTVDSKASSLSVIICFFVFFKTAEIAFINVWKYNYKRLLGY